MGGEWTVSGEDRAGEEHYLRPNFAGDFKEEHGTRVGRAGEKLRPILKGLTELPVSRIRASDDRFLSLKKTLAMA